MLSVGVLYSGQTLLTMVHAGGVDTANFAASFAKIDVADSKLVLATAQKCRWLHVTESGELKLTDRGAYLHSMSDAQLCLREQLFDVIVADPPPWSRRMIQGRFEALKAMPDDARQCFDDCALTAGTTDDVVDWWDRATGSLRTERSKLMLLVGREAERLSIRFERSRTGKEPLWQGIETAVAGFDVLSFIDSDSPKRLKIEVKGSSQRKGDASFHVTRNEWNTATTSTEFHFHLWLVRDEPKLFVVPASDLTPHIPLDQGSGHWTGAELFYRDFSAYERKLA